ncbi:MAG: ABC transporter substrate-binding protein [Myxococcales bacterium]
MRNFSVTILRSSLLLCLLHGCSDPAPADTVSFGLALPFTGASAQRGVNIERAMITAGDEINRAGGVLGREVHFRAVDTHSTTYEGMRAATPLFSDGDAVAVLGPDSNDLALSLAPVAHSSDKLLVTPSATPRSVAVSKDERDHWLRLNPSVSLLADKLAEQIIADDRRHVLIVHVVDSLMVALKDQITSRLVRDTQTRVPAAVAITPDRFPDNTAVIEALAHAGDTYDAVVVLAYPNRAASIVNDVVLSYAPARRKAIGWYFSHTVRSPEFLEHVLTEYIEGGTGVALAVGQDAAAFRELFRERWFGDEPTEEAYYYVDALNLLALATEATGADDPSEVAAATLSDNIRKLAQAGGQEVRWNQLDAGLEAVRAGKPVTYLGLTGNLQLMGGELQREVVDASLWRIEGGKYASFTR